MTRKCPDCETLRRLYWDEGMNSISIGEQYSCSGQTVRKHMGKCEIARRSKKDYVVIKTCDMCGGQFEIARSQIKYGKGRFCSLDCRLEWQQKNPSRVRCQCQICGKVFEVLPSRAPRIVCSRKCQGLWLSDNWRGEKHYRWNGGGTACICETCGKHFKVKNSQAINGRGKYCSQECYNKVRQRNKVKRICEICGKEFQSVPSRVAMGIARFCSIECRGKGTSGPAHASWRGGPRPYPQEWNEAFRQAIRERDNHTCAVCRMLGKDVHHINYVKDDTTPENCITLCKPCHGATGSNRKYWQVALSDLVLARHVSLSI